jgi:hypothetical protein
MAHKHPDRHEPAVAAKLRAAGPTLGDRPRTGATSKSHALFVVPAGPGDGFRASIRGHALELADPGSTPELAPTPDDLLMTSVAASSAWAARGFLRTRDIPDDVFVQVEWQASEDYEGPNDVVVTIALSSIAGAQHNMRTLRSELEGFLRAQSFHVSGGVRIRVDI